MNRRTNEKTKYRGRAGGTLNMGGATAMDLEMERKNAQEMAEARAGRGRRDSKVRELARANTASKIDEQIEAKMKANMEKAATLVQAGYRGWKARSQVKRMKAAAHKIAKAFMRRLRARRDEERRVYHEGQHHLRSERETRHRVIQHLEREKALLLEQSGSEWEDWQEGRERKAAVTIQRWLRQRWVRIKLTKIVEAKDALHESEYGKMTAEEKSTLERVRESVRQREEAGINAVDLEAPEIQPRRLAALQQEMWRRRAGDEAVPFTEESYRRRAAERRHLLGMYLARKDARAASDRKGRRLQKETAMLLARIEGLPSIADIRPGTDLAEFPPVPDDETDVLDLDDLTERIENLQSSTSLGRMLKEFDGEGSALDASGRAKNMHGSIGAHAPVIMTRRAAAETSHHRLLQQMKRQVLPWSKWSYVS